MEVVDGWLCVRCGGARFGVLGEGASGDVSGMWGGVSTVVDSESAEVDREGAGQSHVWTWLDVR